MKIYQIDTFTDVAFKGNAAAVCILEKDYDDLTLKNIAMEMNLSETVFLRPVSDNVFDLRWFTPEVEVSLCGHGTLASAHLLWENGIMKEDDMIYFKTLSGILTAKKEEEWIELDMPKGNLIKSQGDSILFESLKIKPKNIYEDEIVYLLEFSSEEEIAKLNPDFNLMKKARKEEIIVTSLSENGGYDFVSRFFGPAIGVDEDPVTGSAHCYLAPYWIERLDKDEVLGFQTSKRTGYVKCKLNEDRVLIQGKAKTILSGILEI